MDVDQGDEAEYGGVRVADLVAKQELFVSNKVVERLEILVADGRHLRATELNS